MIPLIVIRPQPGCATTVVAARAQGLRVRGFPLFDVEPVTWDAPPPEEIDALLLGSANAVRHAGPALAAYAGKPTYAVGETTADMARAAALNVVATGRGGLQPVLDAVGPAHRRILRLAGRERLALVPPPGATMVERTVYAVAPRPLPPELEGWLARPTVVMLHSAESARHFAEQCEARAIDRSVISLIAIGAHVIEAVGPGWRAVEIAETPRDAAMLALAQRMCQEADGSP